MLVLHGAANCFPPVSFTKRRAWFDDVQPRAALTFVP
jgi:hypothetical protein